MATATAACHARATHDGAEDTISFVQQRAQSPVSLAMHIEWDGGVCRTLGRTTR